MTGSGRTSPCGTPPRQMEVMEREEAERREMAKQKRKEEVDFLKYHGQHLESFLKQMGGCK